MQGPGLTRESSEGAWEQMGAHSLRPEEAAWRKGKPQGDPSDGQGRPSAGGGDTSEAGQVYCPEGQTSPKEVGLELG